jgi:hypothetical protein
MSDTQHFSALGEAFVIEHFGIKGMRWGVRKDRTLNPLDGGRQFTKNDQAALSGGYKVFGVKHPKQLSIRNVDGVTVVRPKNGFKNAEVKKRHDELLNDVRAMRKQYPAVAKLQITIMPNSHMELDPGKSADAGVLHTQDGKLIVGYNDTKGARNPRQQARMEKLVPGMAHEGYAARHEMGHVLAAAQRLTPNAEPVARAKTLSQSINAAYAHHIETEGNHEAAMKRHGLDFRTLAKLSPYAASAPSEAYAELHGHYTTPKLNAKLPPDIRRKAKSMFDEAGGVTS